MALGIRVSVFMQGCEFHCKNCFNSETWDFEGGQEFNNTTIEKDTVRLINQLWKLIPMRENEEDWEKQLETVLLEIVGLNEIFIKNPLFLQLLAKLEGLNNKEISFSLYRKTVFESINLLQELKNYEYRK